jgi:hypothetical protein
MLTRNVECIDRNTMLLPVCLQGIMNVQVGMQRWCQYADKVQVGIQFYVSMLTRNVERTSRNTMIV